ncbi:MAG: KH domain-containing protein [Candidatus Eremiobacteraeota bacterium]|nr:KH domain-containing protein [Candidatus Eremiobacteraeota bacterium]MCW5872234.1 KH domain-containing protein [Candidatus Eremiobacteraeota bacterium]
MAKVSEPEQSSYEELLKYLAQQLVDEPDEVQVAHILEDRSIVLELKVSPKDMGKVIGKNGKIAQALRTLIKAAGLKEGKRVMVEIV